MQAVLFTEGGRNIGLGHLSRAVSLRQALAAHDVHVRLVVHGDSTVRDLPALADAALCNWAADADAAAGLADAADLVVVDSYHAGPDCYQCLAETGALGVWFDDHNRLDYPPGVVVNGALGAVDLPYRYAPEHEYLLGARHLTLHPAFWKIPPRRIEPQATRVLITLGADDPGGLTARVLTRLAEQFGQLEKTVIVGKLLADDSAITTAADGGTQIVRSPDADTMRGLMYRADLAVSAGGQTLCELARTATPTAAIGLGEDQRANLQGWRDAGFIDLVGLSTDADLSDRLGAAVEGLLDPAVREQRSQIAREIMAPCTGLNVARAIVAMRTRGRDCRELRLRQAAADDCCDLWTWRNHPTVRQRCCRRERIDYPQHRRWFHKRLADPDTVLYVADDAFGVPAGQIRFDISGHAAEANVNLSPTHTGRGLGQELIRAGTQQLLDARRDVCTVDALIFPDNAASLRAFAAAGYAATGQVQRDNQPLEVYRYTRRAC